MLPFTDIQHLRDQGAAPGERDNRAFSEQYRRFYGLHFPDATHETGWLPVDGEKIFVQRFSPARAVATVFLLHGYLDHSGLQGPAIARLLAKHVNVVALDHVGHGLSSGDRASAASFDVYIHTVSAVRYWYADAAMPHLLMGHSLGGAIAMTHMLEYPGEFTRAVLIAPLYRPAGWRFLRVIHGFGRRFVKGQKRVWRANTRDLAYRKFVREIDTLSPTYIPTAWVSAMAAWISHFRQLPAVEATVLVVQGNDDTTVDWRVNLPMIQRKFSDVSVHIIAQGRHQLLNELEAWQDKTWAPIEPFLARLVLEYQALHDADGAKPAD